MLQKAISAFFLFTTMIWGQAALAESICYGEAISPVSRVDPIYPSNALISGTEGAVEIEFTIGTNGTVLDPKILNSFPVQTFEASALEAIENWIYEPITNPPAPRAGTPVESPGNLVTLYFSNSATCDPLNPPVALVAGPLFAATLPGARVSDSGRAGAATYFGTIINVGNATANDCEPLLDFSLFADLEYQTTNSVDNSLSGVPNTPADIVPGGSQSFFLQLSPLSIFPSMEIPVQFSCSNTDPAARFSGINTVLLASVDEPSPDVVAITLAATGDGIAHFPDSDGAVAIAMATVNVGSTGTVIVSAVSNTPEQSVQVSMCQTNPTDGACLSGLTSEIEVEMAENQTMTFTFVLSAAEFIPLDPASSRTTIQFFREVEGPSRGPNRPGTITREEVGQSSFALQTDS